MVRVNPRAPNTCAFYLRLDMWKQTPPTACAYNSKSPNVLLNGPRQPARAQHVRVLSAAICGNRRPNSMRLSCNSKSPTQTCVLNGPRQPARAQHVRVICGWDIGNRSPPTACAYRASKSPNVPCVLNGPRQPARAQHVRVLSAAGYVETEVLNSMRLSCNSKSPNVCAEWSASTRARPTRARFICGMWKQTPQQHAYRAILRAQTCVLNGPRQPARPTRARFICGWICGNRRPSSMRLSCNSKSPNVRAEWSANPRAARPTPCAYRAILRTQTCVLNGPRQPARTQHVRVLSAAGYVETEVLNSMRLSCNSKNPNMRAEWSASTRARPTRARFICGWICGNRSPQQHALIVQF
uniref:Uncharacterized protein n=1 Tax=Globodera rostochiensis TaxID=31243 RepID=A0A914HJZ8_GLORO